MQKREFQGTNAQSLLKNKKLLCELSENSLGVRKADDSEVKELSERIKKNRLIKESSYVDPAIKILKIEFVME